jgi:aspartate/methionine/tyrosine aminotransferase
LKAENNWFPDFEEIERLLLSGKVRKGGLFFLNYPQMPTGQLPTQDLFEEVLAFAKKFGILVVHDNPYSFILNDKPMSLFSVPGARENAIELNSLSKAQNMAGWRVGMLIGAKERVEEVLRFKSNMDSGMFLPVQLAAAKALQLPHSWYQELNEVYRKRREFVYELLDLLGASYSRKQAGLFVWASIGPGYESGYELSDALLRQARVFITPGGIFGDAGNKYIRVSLCSKEEKLKESIARVKQFLKK